MRLQDIPGVKITPHGNVNFSAVDKKHPETKQTFQVPGHVQIADFLAVTFGKPARKTTLLLSEKRCKAINKNQQYDIFAE